MGLGNYSVITSFIAILMGSTWFHCGEPPFLSVHDITRPHIHKNMLLLNIMSHDCVMIVANPILFTELVGLPAIEGQHLI